VGKKKEKIHNEGINYLYSSPYVIMVMKKIKNEFKISGKKFERKRP
jgi:hypothetical protein